MSPYYLLYHSTRMQGNVRTFCALCISKLNVWVKMRFSGNEPEGILHFLTWKLNYIFISLILIFCGTKELIEQHQPVQQTLKTHALTWPPPQSTVFVLFDFFSDSDEIYIILIEKRYYRPIAFKAVKLIFILWWKNWWKIPIATIQNNHIAMH